ncbi:hypothetical protein Tco_0307492 [Tanacetum coccineum]
MSMMHFLEFGGGGRIIKESDMLGGFKTPLGGKCNVEEVGDWVYRQLRMKKYLWLMDLELEALVDAMDVDNG